MHTIGFSNRWMKKSQKLILTHNREENTRDVKNVF